MVTILKGATLIDGTGRQPLPDSVVMIEGSKITRVGRRAELEPGLPQGPQVQVINLSGKFLLPGLINVHDHLDTHRGKNSFQHRAGLNTHILATHAARNCLLNLAYGVTTVRDLGAKGGTNFFIKQQVNNGTLLGPRIFTCGQPIAMTGGHAYQICREADGPDEVRKAAREMLKAGADVVKCMASGGYVSQGTDQPYSPQMTKEELRAAVEEAEHAGRPTTVHAHPPRAIRNAIEAGVQCIEHGALLDRETSDLMAQKGMVLVPTLAEGWEIARVGLEYGRPAWLVELEKQHVPHRLERFARVVEAGVKMAVGTDVLGEMSREMWLMAGGGMPALDVIRAATLHGAELVGMADKVGTVETGKLADLLVVSANPLDDLMNLEQVHLVTLGGKLLWPEAIRALIPEEPLVS